MKSGSWSRVLMLVCLLGLFLPHGAGWADHSIPDANRHDAITIDYETRLKFYLDLKTKRFLKKMAVKEKLLMELIQNVTDEARARGKSLHGEGIGFNLIYNEDILTQYDKEIQSLKHIIEELNELELTVQRMEDLTLLDEVDQLKDHLMKVLDDQKLATKRLTKDQLAKMIMDYSQEINRILQIYENLDLFQKNANARGDLEISQQLDRQKQRILQMLEESRLAGVSQDKIVKDYIDEATSIINILRQLESLSDRAESDSTIKLDIDNVRGQIMANIDQRVLELFGVVDSDTFRGVSISEYFQNWKANRIAEYQTKFTRYNIVRLKLIQTGTPEQRKRMLEREITAALLNYSQQNYELAEMQLQQIFETYNEYYPNLDGVIFYQSEANFSNYYYDAARDGYLKIIQEFPNSPHVAQSYFRLMMISYTYGWSEEFVKYFNKVKDLLTLNPEDLNRAYYLAGYHYVTKNQNLEAQKLLENIKDKSKYYLPAQYLLGLVFLNLEKYTPAKKIFEQLIEQKNYPWTDLNYSLIRNESLLKLGYLHFQRGEYDKAITYFDQVSKGYERYDASLLAQAWSNLKKGQYDQAITKVDLICNNYLLSNYTYEALVVSAHCKRNLNRAEEARQDFQYVTEAKSAVDRFQEYNEERKRILKQLDELEALEEKILERQNKKMYPQIVKIRELINDALSAFRYRGAVSSALLEEYVDRRKVFIRQIEEFDQMIQFAEKQGNKEMRDNAVSQKKRLLMLLEQYQLERPPSGMGYFLDYPLAAKEGAIIYRRGIVNKLVTDLIVEKQRVQKDLEIVTELLALSDEATKMDATIDLEMVEEDLNDLNNQLNQFQVWLANHQIEEIKTNTEQWANFSGLGISDIDFVSYRERDRKIGGYSKNITLIDNVLRLKQQQLEARIRRFDEEVRKIEKEMEAEKIRLEKLEKEKYFQDLYFETKNREIEPEERENFDQER